MIVKLGTSSHLLNAFSKQKTYSFCQVKISKLYKCVTARLIRLGGTMMDLQNVLWVERSVAWAERSVAQCISWRPVIMPSNLHEDLL